MRLLDREHYDLMTQFERQHSHLRLDREPKELWPKGIIYESAETNRTFAAFRHGYSFAKALFQEAGHVE